MRDRDMRECNISEARLDQILADITEKSEFDHLG